MNKQMTLFGGVILSISRISRSGLVFEARWDIISSTVLCTPHKQIATWGVHNAVDDMLMISEFNFHPDRDIWDIDNITPLNKVIHLSIYRWVCPFVHLIMDQVKIYHNINPYKEWEEETSFFALFWSLESFNFSSSDRPISCPFLLKVIGH